jgi:adenylate cyclase
MERENIELVSTDRFTEDRIRVLLVDDQLLIGKMIGRVLEEEGDIEFHHCNDPAKAQEAFVTFQPTVILLDLIMPKITGIELLQRFRADPATQNVPIIVLSGKEEAQTKAAAFAKGASDYLVKLPEVVELVARIRHHSHGYVSFLQRNEALVALTESQRKLEIRSRFIRETFGRYLSDDVVSSLLEGQDGQKLGGEERVVTIMMSDLRGFTSLSERYSAENIVRLINNFLGVMTDIILKHNGTIVEFLGDAIFAIFGAPLSRGDDAGNAVACAIEMQQAMARVNEINSEQSLPEVFMGIGLNTGRVAVGNIGSEKRAKYGVVGSHVNLAARIESFTVGGQVLISDSTLNAVGPSLRIAGRREVKPKGVAEPIFIHDVRGVGAPHHLYLPDVRQKPLFRPPSPLCITYWTIEDKDVANEALAGELVAVSLSEAELRGPRLPTNHTNVKLRFLERSGEEMRDDVYCKVVSEPTDEGCVRLALTALPPAIEQFLKGILYWQDR